MMMNRRGNGGIVGAWEEEEPSAGGGGMLDVEVKLEHDDEDEGGGDEYGIVKPEFLEEEDEEEVVVKVEELSGDGNYLGYSAHQEEDDPLAGTSYLEVDKNGDDNILTPAQRLALQLRGLDTEKFDYSNWTTTSKDLIATSNQGTFVCSQCPNWWFRSPVTYEQHLLKTHETSRKEYHCPDCGGAFTSEQLFHFHLLNYCGVIEGRCDLCSEPGPPMLRRSHLARVHSLFEIYSCPRCHCCFGKFANLVAHCSKLHQGLGSFPCALCPSYVKSMAFDELLQHLQVAHKGSSKPIILRQTPRVSFPEVLSRLPRPKPKASYPKPTVSCPRQRASSPQPIYSYSRLRYPCPDCSHICFSKSSLQRHRKIHKCKCTICGKRYKSFATLRKHSIVAHLGKMTQDIKCQHCRKSFKSTAMLNRHIKASHPRFECHLCRSKAVGFVTSAELEDHINAVHYKEKCDVCGEGFGSKTSLKAHRDEAHPPDLKKKKVVTVSKNPAQAQVKQRPILAIAINTSKHDSSIVSAAQHFALCLRGIDPAKKTFENWTTSKCDSSINESEGGNSKTAKLCKLCAFQTPSAKTLETHLPLHETSSKPFTCPDCQLQFTTEQYFHYHVAHYCGAVVGCCDLCSTPVAPARLRQHLSSEHSQTDIYSCPLCHCCFGKFANCALHIYNLHPKLGRLPCPLCPPNSKEVPIGSMAKHLYECHDHHELAIKCEEPGCGWIGFTSIGVKAHEAKVHPKSRITCGQCQKILKNKGSLNIHNKMMHSGKKPHKCAECPKKFTYKADLTLHLVEVHWATKNKCEICLEGFPRLNNLRQHKLDVHGIAPEVCHGCGRGFTTKKYLEGHLRLFPDHNVAPLTDFQCNLQSGQDDGTVTFLYEA